MSPVRLSLPSFSCSFTPAILAAFQSFSKVQDCFCLSAHYTCPFCLELLSSMLPFVQASPWTRPVFNTLVIKSSPFFAVFLHAYRANWPGVWILHFIYFITHISSWCISSLIWCVVGNLACLVHSVLVPGQHLAQRGVSGPGMSIRSPRAAASELGPVLSLCAWGVHLCLPRKDVLNFI